MVFPKEEINSKEDNREGGKGSKDAMSTHKKEQNYTLKEGRKSPRTQKMAKGVQMQVIVTEKKMGTDEMV